MVNDEYVKGRAHSEELWVEVRRAIEAGESFRNVEKLYGIGYSTVSKRAKREGWLVVGGKVEERRRRNTEQAREVASLVRAEAEAVKEVRLELVGFGERMRGVGLRTKRKMVEQTLREVEEGKLSTKERASVLRDLAAVGKVLHRWDRESPEEERERNRRGAINLELMRVPPERLIGE